MERERFEKERAWLLRRIAAGLRGMEDRVHYFQGGALILNAIARPVYSHWMYLEGRLERLHQRYFQEAAHAWFAKMRESPQGG